jgi:predicted AAA+ superfamily ATPase
VWVEIHLENQDSIPYFQGEMIERRLTSSLAKRLSQTPVVALLGSRQVGKTTLARNLDAGKPSHYLDLERPSDVAKLADPELYLSRFSDHLVILDEIQRFPDLFPVLRSLVDERRRAGEKSAQFLILGSASPELLQQSSESLAGRISYLELDPLNLTELGPGDDVIDQHWFRGGYPDSYLAVDDATAHQWCEDFITSYVERHLPQLGITAAPLLLRRLCSMLAHQQGATLNLSKMAGSLGIDGKTARHYIDLLEGLYLVRSLPAWSRNAGKRLVKASKVYWRDSGLLHSLSGLHDLEKVLGHPVCGHSWEGYCIEQMIPLLPKGTTFSHYRTHAGAEVDLVLEYPSGETVALEIKRTLSPRLTPGFVESMKTLQAAKGYYIMPKGETFPLSESVTATSLKNFLAQWV